MTLQLRSVHTERQWFMGRASALRFIHTKRHRQKRYVDGQNGYATHACRHSDRHKHKGVAHQCYNDGDGVVWCEQTFRFD